MSQPDELAQRRELVLVAARLQRALIEIRLDRIQAHPAQSVLGAALGFARRPLARQAALLALGIALRKLRGKPRAR